MLVVTSEWLLGGLGQRPGVGLSRATVAVWVAVTYERNGGGIHWADVVSALRMGWVTRSVVWGDATCDQQFGDAPNCLRSSCWVLNNSSSANARAVKGTARRAVADDVMFSASDVCADSSSRKRSGSRRHDGGQAVCVVEVVLSKVYWRFGLYVQPGVQLEGSATRGELQVNRSGGGVQRVAAMIGDIQFRGLPGMAYKGSIGGIVLEGTREDTVAKTGFEAWSLTNRSIAGVLIDHVVSRAWSLSLNDANTRIPETVLPEQKQGRDLL
ncbi:hypothetical protein K439DRAFT_1610225 [Ramaria rubella]|nr:hypothetical protein K439DRAFT_1610225 [Ramaria rubella]